MSSLSDVLAAARDDAADAAELAAVRLHNATSARSLATGLEEAEAAAVDLSISLLAIATTALSPVDSMFSSCVGARPDADATPVPNSFLPDVATLGAAAAQAAAELGGRARAFPWRRRQYLLAICIAEPLAAALR